MLEEWKKGIIVQFFKKGSLQDCSNWQTGFTFLSVPGKLFCGSLLRRLRVALDKRLREEQAGFHAGRSCCDQIFILRNIKQGVAYRNQPSINFVDFTKAFDSIHRNSLWHILRLYGVQEPFLNIFKDIYLYFQSSCCIKTKSGRTDFFGIKTGVRQGCTLIPMLFLAVMEFMRRKSTDYVGAGIPWTDHDCLADLDFAKFRL